LAKDFASHVDDIVCILGDNIFDNSEFNDDIIDFSRDQGGYARYKACVFLKEVKNPEDYGVAVIEDNGKVSKIVEKPKEFVSNTAVVGLYAFTYDVFKVIENVKPSDRGELEISSVTDHFAKLGQLDSRKINGYWGDAGGSIQRYAECSMHGAKQANVSEQDIDNFKSVVFDDK
jgi:dTDP-glucose pyrophosphorylase